MAIVRNPYNAVLVRAYHNVLLMEETKRKYSRTTTSFRGRNAMEFIYDAADEGKGCRTQGQIAEYLKISRPSCTTLLDKLEELGYVERRKGSTDERSVDVYLTRKGRLVTVYQATHRNDMINAILGEFTPDEQKAILRGFERMNEVFEDCIDILEETGQRHNQKYPKGAAKK